jgi:hypothetical protein
LPGHSEPDLVEQERYARAARTEDGFRGYIEALLAGRTDAAGGAR